MSYVLILHGLFIYIFTLIVVYLGTPSVALTIHTGIVYLWIMNFKGNRRKLSWITWGATPVSEIEETPREISVRTAGLLPNLEPGTSGKRCRGAVYYTGLIIVIATPEHIFRGSDFQVVTVPRIYNLSRVVGERHNFASARLMMYCLASLGGRVSYVRHMSPLL